MNDFLFADIMGRSKLFEGIGREETSALLKCLRPLTRRYEKGDYIFRCEDTISSFCLVLQGEVHVLKEDCWGNRSIIADIGPGDLFGEAFACSGNKLLPVSAVAAETCQIMHLDVDRLLTTCPSTCHYHTLLIRNLVTVLADKNTTLMSKISHLSQRRLRDKLLAYLSDQSNLQGSASFDIPFNRQDLADYLFVDRSALSNELTKLREEGCLTYHRNHFHLL